MRTKTAYLLAFLLLLFLTITLATAAADGSTEETQTYLPLIQNGQAYIVDCMDGEGNFIPCPGE